MQDILDCRFKFTQLKTPKRAIHLFVLRWQDSLVCLVFCSDVRDKWGDLHFTTLLLSLKWLNKGRNHFVDRSISYICKTEITLHSYDRCAYSQPNDALHFLSSARHLSNCSSQSAQLKAFRACAWSMRKMVCASLLQKTLWANKRITVSLSLYFSPHVCKLGP